MLGKRLRLVNVVVPDEPHSRYHVVNNKKDDEPKKEKDSGQAKVISLADLKKK